MAYELNFNVHRVGTDTCDGCGCRVGWGFETVADGTPIFFHCSTCVYETYSLIEIDGALLARERTVAEIERARRAAAVAEENWRDEVMRVWIDCSETAQVHCE